MCRTKRIRLYLARLSLILSLISMMLFGWFIASWVDTNIHNYNGSENNWNIFKIYDTLK